MIEIEQRGVSERGDRNHFNRRLPFLFLPSTGRDEQTKPMFFEALTVIKRTLPCHHQALAQAINNLALVCSTQQPVDEAGPAFVEALARVKKGLQFWARCGEVLSFLLCRLTLSFSLSFSRQCFGSLSSSLSDSLTLGLCVSVSLSISQGASATWPCSTATATRLKSCTSRRLKPCTTIENQPCQP